MRYYKCVIKYYYDKLTIGKVYEVDNDEDDIYLYVTNDMGNRVCVWSTNFTLMTDEDMRDYKLELLGI